MNSIRGRRSKADRPVDATGTGQRPIVLFRFVSRTDTVMTNRLSDYICSALRVAETCDRNCQLSLYM